MFFKKLFDYIEDNSEVNFSIKKKDGHIIIDLSRKEKGKFQEKDTPKQQPEEPKQETEKPKSNAASKSELKKRSKEAIANAAQLFAERKYDEALNLFENALILDPENKHIPADIEKCKKWIEAVSKINIPVTSEAEATDKPRVDGLAPFIAKGAEIPVVEKPEDLNFEIPTL